MQVIALCDVDESPAGKVKGDVDKTYGDSGCRVYADYREILKRKMPTRRSLPCPTIGTLVSVAAANKRWTFTAKSRWRVPSWSRTIVNAVQRNNIIWQTGSQQRSEENFRFACELVRNGRIGKVDYVEVGLPDGGSISAILPCSLFPKTWIGTCGWALHPKCPTGVFCTGTGGGLPTTPAGQLTDWAGHHIDIAHWGLGLESTGPVAIEGKGRPNNDGIYDVFVEYDLLATYANGLKMRIANSSKLEHGMGVAWRGTDGWIHVTRGGLKASDENILKEKPGKDEIHLYKSEDHKQNFIDCVKSRKETIAPAETGHRSISVALLGRNCHELPGKS